MADRAQERNWEGVRLHVVTGKGGTGKTTVAAALAMALASDGGRTLLVEVEGRQGLGRLFDTPPLPYEERRVAVAPGGGQVDALAVDAEEALLEYLEMFYKLGRAGRGLKRLGAVDFVTTVAPGLRDVLLIGKVYEAVRRREPSARKSGRHGRHVYDAVVLDAPPTGRIAHFLNVNAEVAGLARVGPVRGHADSIMTLLRSPETAVHLVTLLEEMPVQETCDAVADLASLGLPLGAVMVNMMRTPALAPQQLADARAGTLDRSRLRAGLTAAGLDSGKECIDSLLAEARDHARRVALEHRERAVLAELARPTYELPQLRDGVELSGVYRLAHLLREQGAA